jgi:hypothetical protein
MARQSAPVGGNQFQVPEAITLVGVDPDHRLSTDYLTRPRRQSVMTAQSATVID